MLHATLCLLYATLCQRDVRQVRESGKIIQFLDVITQRYKPELLSSPLLPPFYAVIQLCSGFLDPIYQYLSMKTCCLPAMAWLRQTGRIMAFVMA